ncbi:MAG: histidine phosphatase family protein [Smithellaceae bacterium]|nr:histidine phosphatase family protein [Smithellaceae bacterium]
MKLILVRHGETFWNREKRVQGFSDTDLSERGRTQIANLGECLSGEDIKAIYCSPLRRAFETASAIGRYHDLPIQIEGGLKEMNFGTLEGLTYLEVKKLYGELLDQWLKDPGSLQMPRGESVLMLQERAWTVVEKIIARRDNALIASHGVTIMAILCRVLGLDFSHFMELHVDHASFSIVEFANGDGRGTLTLLNSKDHLDSLS